MLMGNAIRAAATKDKPYKITIGNGLLKITPSNFARGGWRGTAAIFSSATESIQLADPEIICLLKGISQHTLDLHDSSPGWV